MEVAGKVQVDLLHREHLGIAATGSSALDAEARPQRRFTQGHRGLLPYLVQPQRQSYAYCGLAYAGLRGADGRHQY